MSSSVAIVDYGMGNLLSVANALERVGLGARITSEAADLHRARGIVLPGVGAFGVAMEALNARGLSDALRERIRAGVPFFGVCLGMQLLFDSSEEFGPHRGLGIVKGSVRRLPVTDPQGASIKVPHLGWSPIVAPGGAAFNPRSPLVSLSTGTRMYFVHSYFCDPIDRGVVVSTTRFGGMDFCSSLLQDNVFATQFHPEKSAETGVSVYRQWARHVKGER